MVAKVAAGAGVVEDAKVVGAMAEAETVAGMVVGLGLEEAVATACEILATVGAAAKVGAVTAVVAATGSAGAGVGAVSVDECSCSSWAQLAFGFAKYRLLLK